jgi:hypothetical protein
VKECSKGIKKTLNVIFNESINQDVFPDLFKIAKIGLFKKGDRQEINNYRQFSVLSVF